MKVGALLGMIAFLVFALRPLFRHVPNALATAKEEHPARGRARRCAWVSASSASWLLAHLVAGVAGVAVFGVLAPAWRSALGSKPPSERESASVQLDHAAGETVVCRTR